MAQLVFGLLVAYCGYFLINRGDESISQERFDKSERLCKHAVETQGIIDSIYTETTMKVGPVKTKMYNYKVTFTANGKEYKTSLMVPAVIESDPIRKVWYDREDPTSNSAHDACEAYESDKKKNVTSFGLAYSAGGILIGLIGIRLIWSALISLFVKAVKK